jgi:hypothetical protein
LTGVGGMGTGTSRNIEFSYNDTDTSYASAIKFEVANQSLHGGQVSIWTDNASGTSIRALTVDKLQSVGINTTSIKGKLDVYRAAGQSGTAAIAITNGEGGAGRNWGISTEVVTGGDFAILQSTTNGGVPTPSSANTKLYINPSGSVGVNTTNPSTLLSLQSTLNSSLGGISLIGNSAGDKSNIWTQDIYSKWLHTENAYDAGNGYGRIDFETNAAVNASYPTRGGFSFITAGAGQFVTFTNQGRVGIGITTPSEKTSIKGANTNGTEEIFRVRNGLAQYGNAGASLGVSGHEGEFNAYNSAGNKHIFISAYYASFINPIQGRLAIAKTTSSYTLDVDGTIRATGDVIAYSDARVKNNVKTIDNALEKTTKLRGVSYTRNDIEDKSTKIGVIAQEVLEVLPEVVSKDDEGKYSVSYGNIVGVLIEAIKELEARVKELENK